MKAYKGFYKDMTCKGFQYEEGKEYREDKAELCKSGFHACKNPLDCFIYYSPAESVYHEVELDELSDKKSDDSKICGRYIKIGARLSIVKICKQYFEFIKSMCTNENNAEKGKAATAGDRGAATAGDSGAATAGDSGAATAGNYGAATAGDRGAATAGDSGAATAGHRGAATAGYRGAATAGTYGAATACDSGAATAGDRGAATAGDSGSATAGNYGAATAGNYGTATAGNYGAATAGDRGMATAGIYGSATAGIYGSATAGIYGSATAGYRGAATAGTYGAATAGNYGAATSCGRTVVGKNGAALARGNNVRVKGGLGAILVIAEENEYNNDIKEWKSGIVDGKKIKANTWYKLENGEFVEFKERGRMNNMNEKECEAYDRATKKRKKEVISNGQIYHKVNNNDNSYCNCD